MGAWKVLVVDDDRDIHALTSILFGDMAHEGLKVKFIYADSVDSACEIIKKEKNMALLLLDMVMGDRDAGIQVMDYLRTTCENTSTRLVVRSSVRDTHPSDELCEKYQIDRCVVKSELSVEQLRDVIEESLNLYQGGVTEEEELRDVLPQDGEILFSVRSRLESWLASETLEKNMKAEVSELLGEIDAHLNDLVTN